MRPFIARDDQGRVIVVLAFQTIAYGNVVAVVSEPDGGRVWIVPIEDIRDALPNTEWPLNWRGKVTA